MSVVEATPLERWGLFRLLWGMIARPRQVAMALAKELTNHSLPEIGEAFGGRDHTTVLYATRKIAELKETDRRVAEDYNNLLRTLSN